MQAALETLEHYADADDLRLSKVGQFFCRFFGEIFGCQHRDMSRPFSRHGETYRVCITCGAQRQFDERRWNTQGPFYYKAARLADLRRH